MSVIRLVVLSLATATAIPSISHAALDPAAQECVRRLAQNTAAVASAQAAVNRACVRGGGSGAQATFQPFGAPQRLSETANAAGTLHERGLVADLFGADLGAALSAGKREARCQARVLITAHSTIPSRRYETAVAW
jgi:hypothetical protein